MECRRFRFGVGPRADVDETDYARVILSSPQNISPSITFSVHLSPHASVVIHGEEKIEVQNSFPRSGESIADRRSSAGRFSTQLRQIGLEIVEVATQTAALVSLQRSRPHLVVADESLLSLSAAEMGRLLAQDNSLPWLLVGAAPASLERRRIALQAGAFDYFCIPEELDLLAARALQLVSLRQTFERLRGEADLDSLTGLANRRRFRTVLKREVERWRRYGVPCALILLDIDQMKSINDRFGHPAGDQVIRTVAALLSDVSRDNDTAARLGGEEFALLLANIGGVKAAQAADRLRAAMAQQEVVGVGKFTVSVGVAACPENADSDRALYSASDRALYVAKNEGRNRVSVAPPLQADLPGMHASSQ